MKIVTNLFIILLTISCARHHAGKDVASSNYAIAGTASVGSADTTIIQKHLVSLTLTESPRNYQHIAQLNKTADYIYSNFAGYADSVMWQNFNVEGNTYKNIIASFGAKDAKRIIIGAHYDVYGDHQGADDNASGVTALLELARLLKGKPLKYRIDLVAYSLEEPPFFRTPNMGSFVHAKSLADSNVPVYGMISLEMIGFFSDKPGTQSYPEGVPPSLYGDKGNYIALVMKEGAGLFEQKFCNAFKNINSIKSNLYAAPPSMPGIDFSDHMNYWYFNFNALMITDTSFYRNKNYHTDGDTVDKIDIPRMAKVIDGVLLTLDAL